MRVLATVEGQGRRFSNGEEEHEYTITLSLVLRKRGKQTRAQRAYMLEAERLVAAAVKDRSLDVSRMRRGKKSRNGT